MLRWTALVGLVLALSSLVFSQAHFRSKFARLFPDETESADIQEKMEGHFNSLHIFSDVNCSKPLDFALLFGKTTSRVA